MKEVRGIQKIVAEYKDESKSEVSLDIWYGKGRRKKIPSMKFNELRNGFVLNEKKKDTAPDNCRGCILGLLKRLFHIA